MIAVEERIRTGGGQENPAPPSTGKDWTRVPPKPKKTYRMKFRGKYETISLKGLTKLNDEMAAQYKFSTPEMKQKILTIFLDLNMVYLRRPPLIFKDPMDAEDWFTEFKIMIPGALERYEPSRGHVVAYIIGWKKASINAWVRTKGAIRLPENQRLRFFQIDREIRRIGRDKLKEVDRKFYDEANFQMVSMSAKTVDAGDELIETLVGEDSRDTAGDGADFGLWEHVKKILTTEEYQMWAWKYHPDYEITSKDIGIRLGISPERVRQKLEKIRERLKKRMAAICGRKQG